MRKLIDGHVHLTPMHEDGWRDPLTGMISHRYGMITAKDGVSRRRMPAYFADSSFPVETLIAVLDENQVEKAVVMAHLDNDICETSFDAITKYPDRLRAAISVEIKEESLDALQYWRERGINILKFEMRGLNEFYGQLDVDDPMMLRLFKQAERLGMIAVIDPSPSTFSSYQPNGIRRILDQCPDLKLVVCHMGFPYRGMRQDAEIYDQWKNMTSLAKRDNVWFDVTAIPDLFSDENYPWTSAMEFLNEFVSRYGAEKVIWGTDIPGTFRNATYSQMIRAFEQCSFLTEADKDKLFYENADKLYFADSAK